MAAFVLAILLPALQHQACESSAELMQRAHALKSEWDAACSSGGCASEREMEQQAQKRLDECEVAGSCHDVADLEAEARARAGDLIAGCTQPSAPPEPPHTPPSPPAFPPAVCDPDQASAVCTSSPVELCYFEPKCITGGVSLGCKTAASKVNPSARGGVWRFHG